jgi:hypothetical protein
MKSLFCVLLTFGLITSTRAQTNIDWLTVDAGGVPTASANYIIDATLGQPDAATLTSVNYTIIGGFWALQDLGPASGLPQLNIAHGSPGNVLLSWPSPSTGFVLQENPNLSNPAGWTNVSGSILDDGTHKSISQTAAATNRFYRLQKP